jgi:hypothetical protein
VTTILVMTLLGSEPTRCPTCGDVVGIYEPSVIDLPDGRIVHASIAAFSSGLELGAVVRHRECQLERAPAGERSG